MPTPIRAGTVMLKDPLALVVVRPITVATLRIVQFKLTTVPARGGPGLFPLGEQKRLPFTLTPRRSWARANGFES
ncbi:hypothetical protein ACJIZ3_005547 [Penstemon smallii]|uniref:Uncharacterized protein n=1 Tax=Penstemon smallii TaxID=265156 RepID=A0ABD3S5B7_9LAMI